MERSPDPNALRTGRESGQAIGAGATAGAFALPWLRAKLGPDLLVAAVRAGVEKHDFRKAQE